ncbi:MAG: tryptophan-rich sensory protein [Muribaculaceae bacterium]|nr:tryptophan-rich sensory protein [Muribaculaceae bacterium]
MNIWYGLLRKPPLTPPTSYFPIAWRILYTLMGIAFIIILSKPNSSNKFIAIGLLLFQLLLNFAWSYVFFELKSPVLGMIDVIVLFLILLITIGYVFKVSKLAGWLLVPYILQVIFAIYLNAGILILN